MNNENLEGLLQITQLFEAQKLISFIIGVSLLVIINKTIKSLSQSFSNYLPSKRLLILQIATISIFVIYIVGVIIVFYGTLKPSSQLMLALGGSIAVAMGLALKDIVSSLVSGLILLFDQPFQVGDRVTFNDIYGEIKSIGLRTVRINTLDDNLVTIPNSRFLTDVVSSSNSGNMEMMVVTNFYVSLNTDLEKCEKIIEEAIVTNQLSYLIKSHSIVVSEKIINNIHGLELKVKAYVIDVKYEKLFQTGLTKKVKSWFDEAKIARPQIIS